MRTHMTLRRTAVCSVVVYAVYCHTAVWLSPFAHDLAHPVACLAALVALTYLAMRPLSARGTSDDRNPFVTNDDTSSVALPGEREDAPSSSSDGTDRTSLDPAVDGEPDRDEPSVTLSRDADSTDVDGRRPTHADDRGAMPVGGAFVVDADDDGEDIEDDDDGGADGSDVDVDIICARNADHAAIDSNPVHDGSVSVRSFDSPLGFGDYSWVDLDRWRSEKSDAARRYGGPAAFDAACRVPLLESNTMRKRADGVIVRVGRRNVGPHMVMYGEFASSPTGPPVLHGYGVVVSTTGATDGMWHMGRTCGWVLTTSTRRHDDDGGGSTPPSQGTAADNGP